MNLVYENARGNTISLSENQYFQLINVDGQTTANANISSTVIGGIDGDEVNNVQAQPRSITLNLSIAKGVDVENAKRYVLSYFKIKQRGSLIWTQNKKTVKITGVVESVDMPRWNNSVAMQIVLHCEVPFWEDIDFVLQEISEAINLHYFTDYNNDMLYFPDSGIAFGEYDSIRTRSLINEGDVDVGLSIEIVALSTVTNPIIYNQDNEFFGIGYGTGLYQVTMQQGDIITITTGKGSKTVKLNGVSIIHKVKPQSTWLQLQSGENTFSINSDEESLSNMKFNLNYKQRYI